MRQILVGFLFVLLCGVAGAQAVDYADWDRRLADTLIRDGAGLRALQPPAVGGDGQSNRRLILQALRLLEPVRSGREAMSAARADILLSVLGTIAATAARETLEGTGNALARVLDATWAVYVQPLLHAAEDAQLAALAAPPPHGVVAARWIAARKRGGVTVAELFALPAPRELAWRFTTVADAAPDGLDLAQPGAAAPGQDREAVRLSLLVDLSGLTGARGVKIGSRLAADGRLLLRAEDSAEAVAACADHAALAAAAAAGATKPTPPATPRPALDKAGTEAACRAAHPPVSGVDGHALLVDPRRRLLVLDRPVGTAEEAAALFDIARSLAQDWP